ncbi:MAG: UDP-N-acetylglucosamine 1-carboxyvinyltransferase [Bacteroidetes bacterium]|nr:MAG: UDP-N-acetylglucosamine 1-carboxyvinyltransferase [Bacteroidota bacterium]
MGSFVIEGGHQLHGEVLPQGAKNEALQVLCAVLLTDQPVAIHNLPDIRDVNNLISLLKEMGVQTRRIGTNSMEFCAKEVNTESFCSGSFRQKAEKIRGSIMLIAPLLARFQRIHLIKPGGDKIGRRRIDTHLLALEKLGATFSYDEKVKLLAIETQGLKGAYILLDEASVTGTANVIMAAVMAKGNTTIFNAACEPYVLQLCNMLIRMGAKIQGIGSNLLTITGVSSLGGTSHILMPDMIEVGSFIGLAAMTRSAITIKHTSMASLGLIPDVFRRLGVSLEQRGEDLHIPAKEEYKIEPFLDKSIMTIADAPWPGFSPDLISIALVMATQAKGSVLIHQKMFESRLFFVDKLIDMGAQIILCDPHRATVIGLNHTQQLKGIEMTSPDIRAGVALLIAALSAKGTSVIHNIEQIDRGYQHIDQRLRHMGAQITRRT